MDRFAMMNFIKIIAIVFLGAVGGGIVFFAWGIPLSFSAIFRNSFFLNNEKIFYTAPIIGIIIGAFLSCVGLFLQTKLKSKTSSSKQNLLSKAFILIPILSAFSFGLLCSLPASLLSPATLIGLGNHSTVNEPITFTILVSLFGMLGGCLIGIEIGFFWYKDKKKIKPHYYQNTARIEFN